MIRQWSSIYKHTTELIDASLTWYRSQILKRVSSEARSHHREVSGHRHFSAFAPPPVFLSQKKKPKRTSQNAPLSLCLSHTTVSTPPPPKRSAYVTIRNMSLSPNRVLIEHRPTTQQFISMYVLLYDVALPPRSSPLLSSLPFLPPLFSLFFLPFSLARVYVI